MCAQPTRFSPTPFTVALILSNFCTTWADDAKQLSKSAPKVSLRTVYLVDAIGDAHRISIVGELGGKGKVTLDGNTCTVGQFGDTRICTERFFPPIDVKFMQLRLADSSGQGRRIYRLDGKLVPGDFTYYLIVPRRRSAPHRLVVDMPNDRRRVVSLEKFSNAGTPGGKPELCKNANYRAEQLGGSVTIFAKGQHPTTGWKAAFEQLPIRIFPPQFRLVCVPPTGNIAQVITPFEVKTSFKAADPVKEVVVHHSKGRHKIPLNQNPKE